MGFPSGELGGHIRAMLEVPVMKGETAQEMRNLLETFRE